MGARHLGMAEFVDLYDDRTVVVDVREAAEYVAGHVPGAIFAPMSRIALHLASLPRDKAVHVICATGNRSGSMADLMVAQGIDAISIDGGTQAWVAAGQPLVEGREPR